MDYLGDFPGGPVVKSSPSNAEGVGSIPGWGAKIPRASWPKNQNIKEKRYCNKFNKDFKNAPHHKKKILKKMYYLVEIVKRLNEIISAKCLAWRLAYGKS